MKTNLFRTSALLAAALLATATGAQARTGATAKSTCMITGGTLLEPAGDREGHFVQASAGTCVMDGGLFIGAVMTQNTVWESDGPKGSIASGNGVIRSPGGIAVYQILSGTRTLMLKDGRPVGWTSSGRAVYPVATGTYAPLAGKPFSWTAHATGANQYTIESTME